MQQKREFRLHLAETVSSIRLNYMFKVLKKQIKNKASVADPDAFVDKLRALERMIMKAGIERQKSTNSMMSLFSKSQNSIITSMNDKTMDQLDTSQLGDET